MNNIILDNYIDDITINKDSRLDIVGLKEKLDLNIKINKDVTFIFNLFVISNNNDININVTLYDNSKFIFNNSFIAKSTYNLNIDTNLMGNNITTNVNIRGINEKNGKININMNGYDKKGTKSNVLNEYAKIINKGKQSNIIIPNLLVDTNDVVANHGASIGCINKEELFYLESKGLDKESATKLIENGYILSIMDNKIKDAINEQL